MRFLVQSYVFPLMFAPALFGQARLTVADAVAQGIKRQSSAVSRFSTYQRRRRSPQASGPLAESALDCSIGEHAILGKPFVLLPTGHSDLCLFSSDRGNRWQAQSPGRTRD